MVKLIKTGVYCIQFNPLIHIDFNVSDLKSSV